MPNSRFIPVLSKVRSVDLDGAVLSRGPFVSALLKSRFHLDWSDEQLLSVQRLGNQKANQYWEARKPPEATATDQCVVLSCLVLTRDPTLTTSDTICRNIASYIRTKYVEQGWVALGLSH